MKNTMKAVVTINANSAILRVKASKKYLLKCESYPIEVLQRMLQSLTKYEVKVRTIGVQKFIKKHPEDVIYSLPELSRVLSKLTLEVEVPKITFEEEHSITLVDSWHLPGIEIKDVKHTTTWSGQDVTLFHLESCIELLDVDDNAFLRNLISSSEGIVGKCVNAPFPHSFYKWGYYIFNKVKDSDNVEVYKRTTSYKEVTKIEKFTL